MLSMFGRILLPLLLSACLSFSQAQESQCRGACATSYNMLAYDLINTGNNKYELSKGFFPPDAAEPVLVKVTYHFSHCGSKTWYWTGGTFYIYQPLEVFVFRSLFFSPISARQESIELQLPPQCYAASSEYFELLTQRLKAHAMSQSDTPQVDNNYVAKAVSGDTKLDYKDHEVYGYAQNVRIDRLLLAYQYVPFIIIFGIVIAAPIILCCACCSCDNKCGTCCERLRGVISQKVEGVGKDRNHQARLVAFVTLCSCFTVYNFVLDMLSVGIDNTNDLPGYYEKNEGIFWCTIFFAIASLFFLLVGIIWFIVLLCYWSRVSRCCCFCNTEKANGGDKGGQIKDEGKLQEEKQQDDLEEERRKKEKQHLALLIRDQEEERQKKEKQHLALLIPIVLCVGSIVLSLSFHFQNIIIAWSTDPFYASRIAVYYGIVIFVYYLTFKNTYFLPLVCIKKLTSQPRGTKSDKSPNTKQPYQTCDENRRACAKCCNGCIEKTLGCLWDSEVDEEEEDEEKRGKKEEDEKKGDKKEEDEKRGDENEEEEIKIEGDEGEEDKKKRSIEEEDEEKRAKKRAKRRARMRNSSRKVGLGVLCVAIVGVLLSGFHALNAVFIYYIPINHSIEESVNGVQTIYNGAVILIGGLIAYNVGWFFYHTKKFSVERALEKAMKELKKDPFDKKAVKKIKKGLFGNDPIQYVENGWGSLSEEDRMKEVMKRLLSHGAKYF